MRVVRLEAGALFDGAHGGEGDVVAPGPGDHLHADGEAGAALVGLAGSAIHRIERAAARCVFAGADARDGDDAGGVAKDVVEDGVGAGGEQIAAEAVREGGGRAGGADDHVEGAAVVGVQRAGELPLVSALRLDQRPVVRGVAAAEVAQDGGGVALAEDGEQRAQEGEGGTGAASQEDEAADTGIAGVALQHVAGGGGAVGGEDAEPEVERGAGVGGCHSVTWAPRPASMPAASTTARRTPGAGGRMPSSL